MGTLRLPGGSNRIERPCKTIPEDRGKVVGGLGRLGKGQLRHTPAPGPGREIPETGLKEAGLHQHFFHEAIWMTRSVVGMVIACSLTVAFAPAAEPDHTNRFLSTLPPIAPRCAVAPWNVNQFVQNS